MDFLSQFLHLTAASLMWLVLDGFFMKLHSKRLVSLPEHVTYFMNTGIEFVADLTA